MDITHVFYHPWILVVGIVLLCGWHEAEAEDGWKHPCPQGQIMHHPNTYEGRHLITCCQPTRCGVGFEVQACKENGTADTCRECLQYFNQSRRTSSFTMGVKCLRTDISHDCRDGNELMVYNVDKTKPPSKKLQLCMCPPESGSKFKWPEVVYAASREAFCQSREKCSPGKEPKVSVVDKDKEECTECPDGFFKNNQGHEFCSPKTDCEKLGLKLLRTQGLVGDNVCSDPPLIVATQKPTPPLIVKEPDGNGRGGAQNPPPPGMTEGKTEQPQTTATIRSGSSRSVNETNESDHEDVIPFILPPILVIVLVILIIIFCCHRRRKGMGLCGCVCCRPGDVEKYPVTNVNHSQYKNGTSNGVLVEPQLLVVTKGVNNNINGRLPQHHSGGGHRYPPAQQNGNAVHFSDGSNVENQMFQNQNNCQQTRSPTSRPGILRKSGDHPGQVVHRQYFNPPQDASMDSIVREKLHANVNSFEANQDLGENDPLLVAEGPRPGPMQGHDLVHNPNYAASNSSPVPVSSYNPGVYHPSGTGGHPNIQNPPGMALSAPAGNTNPNFNNIGENPSPVPVQPSQQVTFAPTADTVTFKRSISVIASPEGEVEEEELEANVPRFSQILPDTEDPPAAEETNPILRRMQEMDSPQRESTNLMRLPFERLQHRPLQNPITPSHHRHKKYPHHGHPPALMRACSQPTPEDNLPDHCIMELKEQQLANSLSSSLDERSAIGQSLRSNTGSNQSDPAALKLEDFIGSSEQTDVKFCPGVNPHSPTHNGAKNCNNSKLPDFGTFVIGTGGSAQNTLERKRSGNNSLQRRRFLSGSNRQNSTERKRRSSSSESAQNTLDSKKSPIPDDRQRSCLKNFSLEDGETEGKKLRLGRTVSFESEEEKNTISLEHDTKPKQLGDSLSSSDSSQGPYVDNALDLRKELSVAGDSEVVNESEVEETDLKQSEQELSSSEDGRSSPVGNLYRRSQSESASGSTEAIQKPPPRSLSEEKPLRMERPIAKVKPMPASDNSVNKLVVDGTETEDGSAPAPTATSGVGNILDYSSDSSSGEDNVPPRQDGSRQEENGESGEEEDGGEEDRRP